jgi:hypothetical protein
VVVQHGLEERCTPGNTLAVQPDKPYQGLSQFGTGALLLLPLLLLLLLLVLVLHTSFSAHALGKFLQEVCKWLLHPSQRQASLLQWQLQCNYILQGVMQRAPVDAAPLLIPASFLSPLRARGALRRSSTASVCTRILHGLSP